MVGPGGIPANNDIKDLVFPKRSKLPNTPPCAQKAISDFSRPENLSATLGALPAIVWSAHTPAWRPLGTASANVADACPRDESAMGEVSAISWTGSIFKIGCTLVSPARDRYYAARNNDRRHWIPGWGVGVPRHQTSVDTWKNPYRWNRQVAHTGYRLRIFCALLADFFGNEVPDAWRDGLWQVIRETPLLRSMLLTKRIGNARKTPPLATLANQEKWDRDFRKLMVVPAAWHGVSCEPVLGPIDIGDAKPDWIITSGESGPGFRPARHERSARLPSRPQEPSHRS